MQGDCVRYPVVALTLSFDVSALGWKIVPTVTVIAFTLLGIEVSIGDTPTKLDPADL